MPVDLIVSCEHASNRVPPEYRRLFSGRPGVLATHRAYDPGTLELGRRIARGAGAPLLTAPCTRLLVETNRSPHHRALLSEFSRTLSCAEREKVLAGYYFPHRDRVEQAVRETLARGSRALHIGVHSFTPVLRGRRRNADVGLLYDPQREPEVEFCKQWQQAMRALEPAWTIRRNYPYRGTADGLTTYLRDATNDPRYLGIELEINQKYPRGARPRWRRAQCAIVQSLRIVLHSL